MFHFAIEEGEPIIYLVIKDEQLGDHPGCVWNSRECCWKAESGTHHDHYHGHLRNDSLLAKRWER